MIVDPFNLCKRKIDVQEHIDHMFEDAKRNLLNAERDLNIAKTEYDRSYERVETAKKELQALCPHTKMLPKSQYHEGGYYDKAYTTHWSVCECCGKQSPRRDEQHSWYG